MPQQLESFDAFVKQVEKHLSAIKDDTSKCMVAVWKMEDGKITMERSTWDYPTAEFDRSIGMLAENLSADRNILDDAPTIPLPTATLDLEALREG